MMMSAAAATPSLASALGRRLLIRRRSRHHHRILPLLFPSASASFSSSPSPSPSFPHHQELDDDPVGGATLGRRRQRRRCGLMNGALGGGPLAAPTVSQRRGMATKRQRRAAAEAAAAAAEGASSSSEGAAVAIDAVPSSSASTGHQHDDDDEGSVVRREGGDEIDVGTDEDTATAAAAAAAVGVQEQEYDERQQQSQRTHAPHVAVDVKTLYDPTIHLVDSPDFADPTLNYEGSTPLGDELTQLIAIRGPISLAEYMRQALTHPDHGYYTSPTTAGSDDDDDSDDDDFYDDDDPSSSTDGTAEDDDGASAILGHRGDFTTAPEISQVFGESLLIFFLTQWEQMGRPTKITLIEAGPGRGTLMADLLSAAVTTFPKFVDAVCEGGGVHLVETSEALRVSQKETLRRALHVSPFGLEFHEEDAMDVTGLLDTGGDGGGGEGGSSSDPERESSVKKEEPADGGRGGQTQGRGGRVVPVRWHHILATVPIEAESGGAQFIVAQEFVDALPVHSFQKTSEGVWRERLVDVAAKGVEDGEDGAIVREGEKKKKTRLRFVLSPGPTTALRTLLNTDDDGRASRPELDDASPGDVVEVCPEGASFAQDVAGRVRRCDGAALIIDYGSGLGTGDSARAFRRHEQVHILSLPGRVDVTADVDFGALKRAVDSVGGGGGGGKERDEDAVVEAYGPVTQGHFLASMGAVERVSKLIDSDATSEKQATDLYFALERLMLPEHMGERYKVLAIVKKGERTGGGKA